MAEALTDEDVTKSESSLRQILVSSLKYSVITVFSLYVFFGSLMCVSKDFRNTVLFLHIINVPLFANFSRPENYGLENAKNFYFDGEAGRLGAWFVSPKHDNIKGMILYLHGNGGTRATSHRVGLYKRLSELGYQILVIDYRGFGDSDGHPTEKGVVNDSKVAWNWLKDKASDLKLPALIWGHSLGSGVAIQLSKFLCEQDSPPDGLVLEAPFNSVYDAAKSHPFAKPYSLLPFYDEFMIQELKYAFMNDYWIQNVTSPILILHDKSDDIVPYQLGHKLCLAAQKCSLNVECVDIEENLSHKYIYKSKKLEEILKNFEIKTKKL
ncbi:lysophosphatidylserine lipase ABHD12-like [Rhopilema esculentum]|uniref:lysophosphatidylserine lipase ABHD12-like n=1 Tax=Rhopilema esculentum TaxID=499914 RepID=UPI0031E2F8E0